MKLSKDLRCELAIKAVSVTNAIIKKYYFMIENQVIYMSCLFKFSEKIQLIPEEIYTKDDQLFPPPEDDKVGWM